MRSKTPFLDNNPINMLTFWGRRGVGCIMSPCVRILEWNGAVINFRYIIEQTDDCKDGQTDGRTD